LQPGTRISLGLMLDERAAKHPGEVCFLFGDRAHRQSEVKYRVDSVAKGLVGAGVRHGERVGVLMGTRPSAFTVIAALSRIGATAVLLRPEGELVVEAELGQVAWVISDPEHAAGAAVLDGVRWGVLGSGSDRSELSRRVIDLELIDPDAVELPVWYRPNPQRATDIAFVVFTGERDTTRAVQISNGRWARSALGTASAAALGPGDTVYSVTPHQHSSALLMSVGGAVAAGARFAMASAGDPGTFWAEVRRYGATHVSYTWASLHDITLAPPDPNEQHHPIRMFMGSGMPANQWRRVVAPSIARRAVDAVPSVDLSVAYGVPDGGGNGTAEVLVVAVTLRPGVELTGAELARVCDRLPASQRPSYVQVVPSIPLTTWSRPIWRGLRQAGLPTPGKSGTVWQLDVDQAGYRKLP
ncbi:MAG: AMP-binding protein, partial [Pseudonocardiales bacterium]|nr:AMP-binding protein [Pseudonocardiales bacterium]